MCSRTRLLIWRKTLRLDLYLKFVLCRFPGLLSTWRSSQWQPKERGKARMQEPSIYKLKKGLIRNLSILLHLFPSKALHQVIKHRIRVSDVDPKHAFVKPTIVLHCEVLSYCMSGFFFGGGGGMIQVHPFDMVFKR
ncbi:uncharacterized protein LOC114311283 [Camellia sinensis]|uniref:uncharacterized protein LOC114311283 n=1 Tax=Camellia sinensis TaxID=4442 RepID=UPI0010359A08|nr:uncharacterized protein LOC114311283 [Camellia sinensis]